LALIRKIEIENFRSIQKLDWLPSAGINCLIGAGDSGKSSILDAIDLCLGARRSFQVSDADFFNLDVEKTISITLALGNLNDGLKNYEKYGDYLRGYNALNGTIEDEPRHGLEDVLSLNVTIEGDLEPRWRLISDRTKDRDTDRNLNWKDRVNLAPTRLGASSEHNLAWRHGSVLNRLSEEKPDASKALSQAARDARKTFGDDAEKQLSQTLATVKTTADSLGIPIGPAARALLDTHSVSFSGGSIALHDDTGVPMRNLGLGSTRLLIAGLQREASATSSILLVDEIENGLEPHRIIRLLGSLGAKINPPPQQVFATSHAAPVLRELSHAQLYVLRKWPAQHYPIVLPATAQGSLRLFPEAFLAPTVLVCEGATEIGFIRGFDQFCVDQNRTSIFACGVSLVDCGGGHPDKAYERAKHFQDLHYRVGVFRDDDLNPTFATEQQFKSAHGGVFTWSAGQAIEDAIFQGVADNTIQQLLEFAVQQQGEQPVSDRIVQVSGNTESLANLRAVLNDPGFILNPQQRTTLGTAAGGKNGWFKSVTLMETATRTIIGPGIAQATEIFKSQVSALLKWAQVPNG